MKRPSITLTDEQKAKLQTLFAQAKALGIKRIVNPFSGSGDEGSIEGCNTEDGIKLPSDLVEELDEIAESIANDDPTDWVNGEGGFGEVVFDIENNKVEIEMNYYETVSHNQPTRATRL